MTHEDRPMAHAGMASEIELQKQYYHEGKVFILQIESTLRCPQFCKYCYAGSKPDSKHGMSSDKIKELLEAAANLDIRMIDWLGGDPLVRKDWYELCMYASSLGLINNIWTSGIPLANEDVARKAVEVTKGGFISTHLDSLNPDIYGGVHVTRNEENIEANIQSILDGIQNCLDAGKEPEGMVNCITFTSSLGEDDIESTITSFQDKFGIKTCLTLFNPVITKERNEEWAPSRDEIKRGYELRDKINYPGDISCGPMDVSKFYCGTVVCVTAEGWLVPCSVIRTEEFGNVKETPLEILVDQGRNRLLYLDFRDDSKLPGGCGSCKNNVNCFGCRSSAYYYNGDIMAADPKCFHYNPGENEKTDE